MQQFELKGQLVTLSNDLKAEYADELASQANSEPIYRNLAAHSFPHPYTRESAIFFLDKNREDGSSFFALDFLIWVEGKIAGAIGLSEIEWTDRKAHMGYWLGEKFWNHGYATEALKLMVEFSRKELNLVRLYAKVLDYNLPSLKVLMKNGFEIEGYERKAFKMGDGYHSFILTARVFEE